LQIPIFATLFSNHMTVKRNAALSFIFITILLDCIGFGVIIPVVPKLIQELTGGNLSSASKVGGWLMFSYAVMQFICAPIMGALSDRFGRRPVLLASLFGLGIDYILVCFAPTIAWLFAGRIVAGLFGASITTAQAYIADVSTPEKRAQNFGLVGAAFGLGFVLGPAIGGVFSDFGLRVPFMIAAGLALLNFVYGYFILPESLLKENRRAFDWKRANPVGALAHIKRYPAIGQLLAAMTLIYIASHAVQGTWSYYTMEKFNWDSTLVGYSLAAFGVTVAAVQGGLIRVVVPKLGKKNSVFFGLTMYAVGFACFAFATKGWMMFVFIIPYCLSGFAMPALQGIVSSKIPVNEQGELQGLIASMLSATSIIGPLIMTNLFAYFTNPERSIYFPGAPFIAGSILAIVGILIVIKPMLTYHAAQQEPVTVQETKEAVM
jgi:MFS transporter, DHA1 family, tetracycline resistance protein